MGPCDTLRVVTDYVVNKHSNSVLDPTSFFYGRLEPMVQAGDFDKMVKIFFLNFISFYVAFV